VAWIERSLQVEKWTSIREIGVVYDAALVVTADREGPQSSPGNDSFTVWNASLTSHIVAPLLKGVNLRWFDWQHFADDAHLQLGDPLEIAVAADGVVQIQRAGEIPTLAQLVAQITPENRYAEISLGAQIGREAVEW
jgi:antitoxin component of MazEF toxin-antitoxin module